MRLTKTAVWALGITIMLLVLCINRGLFLAKAVHAEGTVISSKSLHQRSHGITSARRSVSYQIEFEYEGYTYTFWTSSFTSSAHLNKTPVIFNPDDPTDAYQNSFGDFWGWGLIYIALAFVPWSAAALSFIGKNERLVIGRKKFGIVKVVQDDY
jgi:hypothetical protein